MPDPSKSLKSKAKSAYERSGSSKVKLTLKGGTAVDPDSGLQDQAHVYQERSTKWTCVLGLTDIQRNMNKYYKLQLLKADQTDKYYVFRSWGRIGK